MRKLVFIFSGFFLLAGCQARKQEPSVSGKVTYKGEAVKAGTISFNQKGKKYTAALKIDGTYVCPGVPPGDYEVTITPIKGFSGSPEEMTKQMKEKLEKQAGEERVNIPQMTPKPGEFGKAAPGNLENRYVPVPEKYADPKTSGLKAKIEPGDQTLNFSLSD